MIWLSVLFIFYFKLIYNDFLAGVVLELQFFRHSFFRFKFGNVTVLADPFINNFGDSIETKSLVKCPVSEKSLGFADIVLLSQEHFDHFDKKTVESVCSFNPNARVVAHDSVLSQLEINQSQKKAIMSGDKFTLLGIEFEVLPAHFPKSFYPVSFILRHKNSSVFFAGDTALTDNFNGVKVNVAILPIGGHETMDIVDAVKATKTIKPDYIIPMHYDTFESIKADPLEFKSRIEKSILKTSPVILKPGEKFSLKT